MLVDYGQQLYNHLLPGVLDEAFRKVYNSGQPLCLHLDLRTAYAKSCLLQVSVAPYLPSALRSPFVSQFHFALSYSRVIVLPAANEPFIQLGGQVAFVRSVGKVRLSKWQGGAVFFIFSDLSGQFYHLSPFFRQVRWSPGELLSG
ncbi:MAG: hypothetical protein HXX08_13960 [Chloroflexi bacterium]|uniref:Uncharacterized protein n=1 Tax=Candidatus Chlorohelix allophototropha TaxID=3003348 RepID=A0A8T7M4J1_9CHLR|nr:hypothetical protein [Chloroflexota bacterium]WJW70043.1 hypothetical protein OZ401_004845 [Chloroflexota bacterium L227-S17]